MTNAERAGFLPGIPVDDVHWETLNFARDARQVQVAVPLLSEAQLESLAREVRAAGQMNLRPLLVTDVMAAVDTAIARLLDRGNPYRCKAEALLPLVTGYDHEMVRLGLTEYLKTFRRPGLEKFLTEDFSNSAILDRFVPIPKGGFAQAFGPALLYQSWAGNVPGLSLWSLISGLLVKAPTIGKLASAEPLFAGWFAEVLADVEPKLAQCMGIVWWPGGDEAREAAVLRHADVVLAYGGNEALAQIRARTPISTRVLSYGHKVSFGIVARSALDAQQAWSLAHQAAYDVVRYDQQGCYSPHVFFVERNGSVSPEEFAHYVANELASFEHKFPRRALAIDEASTIAKWRDNEEALGVSQAGRQLLSDPSGAWAVAYVETPENLTPSGLNRTVKIVAIDNVEEVAEHVSPYRGVLQTAGVAAAPQALFQIAQMLGNVGVTRVTALGCMSAPEAGWHHDGRFNLLDLVTLTEIERSAEVAAEAFAPYRN
ncbi:MAG: hypothetical protein ACI8PT_000644 [Gammaproteobacteria bacterium]|jgi:hypothetical protein